MITILQLTAIGNSNEVLLVTTDERGQKRFLEVERVSPLLEPLDPQRFRHKKLLFGGQKQNHNININPNIIYNSVSDPDRCSRALHSVQQAAKENPFPFINHPALISNVRGDKLYELTKDIEGLKVPKCIRCTPRSLTELQSLISENRLSTPILIQEAGTYPEQKSQYLFKSTDDIHTLERFAFDGRAYYVKQFHNYISDDNLYRKYRFFVIGNKILPGYLMISTEWQVRNDKESHKNIKNLSSIKKEEKAFLKKYQKKRIPALVALQERLGLDFVAIDCNVNIKGEITLFGIDCAAHYFENVKKPGYYTQKQIQRYNEAVETMILNKIKTGGTNHV